MAYNVQNRIDDTLDYLNGYDARSAYEPEPSVSWLPKTPTPGPSSITTTPVR